MNVNPYKFKGPLDPVKDELVCVPRADQVKQVIRGMIWGDHWAIIGPRQFGKSTFLRQLQNSYTEPCYIPFNFEISPKTEEEFYQWLAEKLIKRIPKKLVQKTEKGNINDPIQFLDFLEGLQLKDDKKKIALLFDEVELIPSIKNFLHVWRKLFHERHYKKGLEKYSIIITGSVDLIKETMGETSPFNIAHTLYLKDFSDTESVRMVDRPFNDLNIKIEKAAKIKLMSQVSGQPQLLQQLCHLLVEIAIKENKIIIEKDVDAALNNLFKNSTNRDILRHQLKIDNILETLAISILKGKQMRFIPYKEYSFEQAGPIIEDEDGFCTFRNKVYKKFIEGIIETLPAPKEEHFIKEEVVQKIVPEQKKPMIFICYSHEDKDWKKELSIFMGPLKLMSVIIWDDENIRTGEKWFLKIQEKINDSDIAILLVSKYSLDSDFICNVEIPYILKKCEEGIMKFFPILISQCPWKLIPWLKNVQIRQLEENEPLAKLPEPERDDVFTDIIYEIAGLLDIYENEEKYELETKEKEKPKPSRA